MVQYATNFGDIPEGDEITDHGWTRLWGNNSPAPQARLEQTPFGDRYVDLTQPTGAFYADHAWVPTGADSHAVTQVIVGVRRQGHHEGNYGCVGRASGGSSSRTGMCAALRNNATDVRIVEFDNNTANFPNTEAAHGVDPSDWALILLDLNGPGVRIGVWQYDDPEPDWDTEGWTIEDTTGITSAGVAGLFCRPSTGDTIDWGYFAYGTDNDPAPRPGDTGDPEPPWSLTVNTQGQGSVDVEDDGTPVDPETHDWDDNDPATLIATPDSGWQVADPLWTGDVPSEDANDNPLVLPMDQDRTVTANFEEEPPLDTPSNVQVTITSRTSATVTWEDVVEADEFEVEGRVRSRAND